MKKHEMTCEQALAWICKMCANGDALNGHEVDFGGNCESCFIGQTLAANDKEAAK